MTLYYLSFRLQSDGLLGRGDGVAGLVDEEVQHDGYGCPYFGGRTIKGILTNECADILAALPNASRSLWDAAALSLFGQPGSSLDDAARLRIGPAQLPGQLREAIQQDIDSEYPTLSRESVLASLTTVRRETAIDPKTDVADDHTLRAMRMVLRETFFVAELDLQEPDPTRHQRQLQLLAACLKAFRRIGTGRNRGHGRLKEVALVDGEGQPVLEARFEEFCQEVS